MGSYKRGYNYVVDMSPGKDSAVVQQAIDATRQKERIP